MKLSYLATAAAALALAGGAAFAQQADPGNTSPETSAQASPTTEGSTTSSDMGSKSTSDMGSVNPSNPSATNAAPATVTATTAETTTTPAAPSAGVNTAATFTNMTVTNGPVPDTPENRAKYGAPMSRAGKHTAAKGN